MRAESDPLYRRRAAAVAAVVVDDDFVERSCPRTAAGTVRHSWTGGGSGHRNGDGGPGGHRSQQVPLWPGAAPVATLGTYCGMDYRWIETETMIAADSEGAVEVEVEDAVAVAVAELGLHLAGI